MPPLLPPYRVSVALASCALVALVLFTRSPATNFVFDEQEALLANPYVQGQGSYLSAFAVDFWGRPPAETIGSYRPLPNLAWRLLAFTLRTGTPFFLHLLNVLLHACCAALLGAWVRRESGDERAAWLAALIFVSLGLSTEVVCSVVGLADVLAALSAVGALAAVTRGGVSGWLGLVCAGLVGLWAKETMLSTLPLIVGWGWVRRARAPLFHRCALPLAPLTSLVAYVAVRAHSFPVSRPHTETALGELPALGPLVVRALEHFGQPRLVPDPINNPLVGVDFAARLPTVARVFGEGGAQLWVPWGLSGDYSFAATRLGGWSPGAWFGAMVFALPLLVGVAALRRGGRRARLFGGACCWVPLTQLWVSNALVLLPTVRADRLWYLPSLGFAVGVALLLSAALRRWPRTTALGGVLWLSMQAFAARAHALDYSNDLRFWAATARTVPLSAKAQLNWGVMLGARGRLEERVAHSQRAVELAPEWPMGRIYLGDALCRSGRVEEAWPHYRRGLELGPQQSGLVALALQCLWDRGGFAAHEDELLELAELHPGSWLSYLAFEVARHGSEHGGVPAERRPRGYDQKVGAR